MLQYNILTRRKPILKRRNILCKLFIDEVRRMSQWVEHPSSECDRWAWHGSMLCVVDQSHDQYPVSPRLLLVSSGQLRSAALWPGQHCVTRPHVGDDASFTSVYTHVLIEYVECEELSVNVSVFIWAYQRLQWDTLSLVSQLSIVTFHYYQSFSLSSTLLQPAPACCKLWHSKKLKDRSFKADKKFHHQVFPGVGWCKYKNVFSGLVTEGGDDMVDMVGWLGWPGPRRQQHWQTPACERGQQCSVRYWMLLLTASGDNKQLEHLISRSARYDQHQYDGIIQQWMVFCVDVEHCW